MYFPFKWNWRDIAMGLWQTGRFAIIAVAIGIIILIVFLISFDK